MGTGWFLNRAKASLDVFWLRYESLEDSDNLPDSDVLAQEIVADLEVALEQFREIAAEKINRCVQFNLRISYRSVFAVTCGLANRLCRRFIIYAILPKIFCF